ncbi:hypothetical protein HETIRDRAFT_107024 [Heterobasidion irregulare TC 32-1]|uniref:Uncharacterized protein n=1 Tax=Heterobasidion irregulare (strain TC 32-1) TaxID=747525 RepID=W4KCS6_HETIT|nr:uncharacterized protein HETIRDRAFT_107024 [Heterobasidion irregulare TC 32-1]ETW82861.1 hypothetical protein HETIRDRAFT_107024 [Heterobasidion irregulare TC 32-1]
MRAKRVPYPSDAHPASAASISSVRYRCVTPLNAALNAHPVFCRAAHHNAPSSERVPAIFVPRAYQPRLRHLNYLVAYVCSMMRDVAGTRAADSGSEAEAEVRAEMERALVFLNAVREAFFEDVRAKFYDAKSNTSGIRQNGESARPRRMDDSWRSPRFDAYLRELYFVRNHREDAVGRYVKEHGALVGDPVQLGKAHALPCLMVLTGCYWQAWAAQNDDAMACYGTEDDEGFYHGIPAAKEEARALKDELFLSEATRRRHQSSSDHYLVTVFRECLEEGLQDTRRLCSLVWKILHNYGHPTGSSVE